MPVLILALAAAAMLAGCKKYDDTDVRDDIRDLQNRVTALETWCETAKSQISSLQGLVTALESKNFITGVTPVMEGTEEVGYTITFQAGNPITIKHGKNGDPGVTPRIGASKDPGNPSDESYYWTVKIGDGEPEFILDEQENKIAVSGNEGAPGHTPVLSVEEDGGVLYWKVDGEWLLNDGEKVPATGEPGDAIFDKEGCDFENPTCVTFKLTNGTTLTLPRAGTLTVGFDSYEVFMLTPTSNVIDIILPETLKEEDYTALVAEVKNEAGTNMDIQTRAAPSPWQVELAKPTFVNGEYQNDAKATVTAAGASNGDRAILKVTLIDSKGQEISASRILEFDGTIVNHDADGLVNALSDPMVTTIEVVSDIDLSTVTVEDLTFDGHKTIDIQKGATIQLGKSNRLTANHGLTLKGGGTIDNTSDDNSDLGSGYPKSLIHITGGDLVIDGVTLINDADYHWHGNAELGYPYNSAAIAYWNDANVTITNARIISGEFTVCGMGRDIASGNVTLTDSYFESTSTNKNNGINWAYAMRLFGSEVTINNCEVKGIQGCVSVEGCNATINGGKYYTVNTEGNQDAFYPLYVTNGAVVTITNGEFSSPNDRSGLQIEGTSAVVAGDNDSGLPEGNIVLKGGKFSGKAYNHITKIVYDPADGYKWQAINNDESLKWEVVAE